MSDHNWIWVPAKTPSGKIRQVRKCTVCGLVTYPNGRLTRWVYANGHVAETATIDAPSCH